MRTVVWVWFIWTAVGYDVLAQNTDTVAGPVVTESLAADSPALRTLLMFWNLENYFDPFDDLVTDDDEFLPQGYKHWTWKKFEHKRNLIAKTILAVKDDTGLLPAVIGFAEVENRMVLNQLVRNTALIKTGYEILHRNSPDRRGIDVALIYRTDDFMPIYTEWIPVSTDGRHTRDFLYVRGLLKPLSCDTLDIFVVHWPSKFGGEKQSLPFRMHAAHTLHDKVKTLNNNKKNVFVMGDFNDIPESVPMQYIADSAGFTVMGKSFGTTPTRFKDYKTEGTLKYKGKWEMIDNFLLLTDTSICHNNGQQGTQTAQTFKDILPNLIQPCINDLGDSIKKTILLQKTEMFIFNHPMLLEKDRTYLGYKPFRTYYGPHWNKGVSDHLPILLLLQADVP